MVRQSRRLAGEELTGSAKSVRFRERSAERLMRSLDRIEDVDRVVDGGLRMKYLRYKRETDDREESKSANR